MSLAPAALLLALAAVPARAETAGRSVARALDRAQALVAREDGADALTIAALDREAGALYRGIAPHGWRAAAPLGAAALDARRPVKVRLFAVVFLGRLGDPAAFAPLSKILLDPGQDPELRSAAVDGLAALEVPPEPARRVLCAALSQPELPRPLLDEVLIPLTRLGCAEPSAPARVARAFGARPSGGDLDTVARSLTVLSRTRGAAPARDLLSLVSYFPALSPARADAIAALARKRSAVAAALAPQALPVLREALRTQSDDPATMTQLVGLASSLGAPARDLLLPLVSHPDAEVLADAAAALARLRCVKALPGLEAVVAGAMSDPRFAPKPGRPDPAVLLERVQTAVADLRRDRDARR